MSSPGKHQKQVDSALKNKQKNNEGDKEEQSTTNKPKNMSKNNVKTGQAGPHPFCSEISCMQNRQ